ncbi:MAG: GntR family transcriptional regulator, partial [Mesorhizobium sp.]
VQAEHSALAQATLDRDAAKASALLREHYLRTVEHLAAAINS